MKKVGLIIDSTVYLDEKTIKDNNIEVVSLNIVKGNETFKEVEVDNQFVYDNQTIRHHLLTSQPAPGEFLETYEKMLNAGYEKILCVLLSKDISGTFQSATLAQNMLDDPSKIYIFDTQLAAYGNEMIALEVIDMIKAEKTGDEIIERINKVIQQSEQMFTVENLFSLVKGGRLKLTKAAIGTVLRVKPIVRMIDGKLELVKSERTYKKLHKYMVDSIKETQKEFKSLTIYMINKNSDDSAEKLKSELLDAFPNAKITVTDYLGPVFTIHVGKKGYGISYFVE